VLPVLVDLGGFQLRTYGAAGAAGFLLVAFLGLRDARHAGWDRDAIIDVIVWTALAAIVGARALFLLQNPSQGLSGFLDLRGGGMVFYGALLGLPVGWWTIRRKGLPLWAVLDTFGRALPLGHGVARLGCFGAGCCYGTASQGPLAVVFTDPLSAAPRDIPLHPVQLYEAAGLFAIGAALSWLKAHKRFDGQVMLTYLGTYAVLRILTERFRGDAERRFWFPELIGETVSTSTGIAVIVLALVAIGWTWRARDAAPDATT